MPLVKILEHFPSTENYEVGETYDITNPSALIVEGKVELVNNEEQSPVEPVASEPTEGSQPEGAEEPVEETEEPVEETPKETPVEEPKEEVEEPVEETEETTTE